MEFEKYEPIPDRKNLIKDTNPVTKQQKKETMLKLEI